MSWEINMVAWGKNDSLGNCQMMSIFGDKYQTIIKKDSGSGCVLYTAGNDVIIFSPSSDDESSPMPTIQGIIDISASIIPTGTKFMIFPVAEEHNSIFFGPRNHWVTVYYDIALNEATVIDSRPALCNFFYRLCWISKLLAIGLKPILNTDIQFKGLKSLGVQLDHFSCGWWTLAVIDHLITHGLAGIEDVSIQQQPGHTDDKTQESVFAHTTSCVDDFEFVMDT